jgi:Lon protease-like protein
MSGMSGDLSALMDFGGIARLFPLPNLVLFPHVVQPLHIFEPRYRQMTADALAGDRLIALALLQPGWEANYAGRPRIYPVACLSRIAGEQRLEDGRYNLLVRGLARVRLSDELASAKLYRSAQAELLADDPGPGPATERRLRRQLARQVSASLGKQPEARDQIRKLLKGGCPLGIACDILAFALALDVHRKQELLETLDIELRTRRLLGFLKGYQADAPSVPVERRFPPDFSQN